MKAQQAALGRGGQASAPAVVQGRPLLEREHEIEVLDAAVVAAARGAGQIVVVEAAPGMGKTRLLAATRAAARGAGLLVLEGRGAQLERGFAFGVARQMLEPAIAGLDAEERAPLFTGAAGLAARLFDADHDDATGVDATFATLHGLYWLVVNLADRGPVVVCVDDMHWADAQTLRFLDFLAHRVEGLPVAMVLAGRPPEAGLLDGVWAELAAQPEAVALLPQPLSEEAVRTLVGERLGPDPAAEFCAACHLATHGNPLFLRELLGALAENGVAPSAEETGEVTSLGAPAVSRFVLHRLATLGPQATELARAVSVLGDETDVRLAARVAGLAEDDARRVADALVRADVLGPDERLTFVHPIVRAAIYEDLAPGERQLRHAAAADVIAGLGVLPDRVAAHLLLTAPARDGGRSAILREAAGRAERRGDPETAAVYLRRALEEPPPDDELGAILATLGRCELAAMQFAEAEQHLQAAVATSADPALRAGAASLLGRCAVVSGGRSAEAAAATIEALVDELSDGHRELALDLGCDLLIVSVTVPRLRSGLDARRERFRRLAAGDAPYEAVAEIHAAQDSLLRGGPAAPAVERSQAALAAGLPAAANPVTVFVALTTFAFAERYDLAQPWLDVALDLSRRQGNAARQGLVLGQRSAIALARGDLADAQLEAETGLALVGARHFVVVQLAAVAMMVHIERGDLDAAARVAERGGVFGDVEDRMFLEEYLIARGRLRIAQGQVAEGVEDLLGLGERLEARDLRWSSSWRAHAALGLAALGDEDRATELAREQIAITRRMGLQCGLGQALRAGGVTIGGDEGLALLEEAVAVLEPSAARLELAYALAALGAELGRRRRRREGREALRLAMQLAARCGALALAERARAELTAGGGRRPRLELTGVDALTPSERRVCELAASGDLTNRAIAQTLFVTEKTVELHLRNAYRKLGIRSRFQLGAALET
jgi:DNA-binding CsgD family transcriptional regulator